MRRLANWLVGLVLRHGSTPEQKKMVYGVTTDSTLHLSDIPVVLPGVGKGYMVAKDLRTFEVVGGNRETGLVMVMEEGSTIVHTLDVELFDLLFIKPSDTTA